MIPRSLLAFLGEVIEFGATMLAAAVVGEVVAESQARREVAAVPATVTLTIDDIRALDAHLAAACDAMHTGLRCEHCDTPLCADCGYDDPEPCDSYRIYCDNCHLPNCRPCAQEAGITEDTTHDYEQEGA